MKASEFGCGVAHELAITWAKVGGELTDFTALAQSDSLCKTVLGVIRNGGLPNIPGDAEAQLVSWESKFLIALPVSTVSF